MKVVLSSSAGYDIESEAIIRSFYRSVYINQCEGTEEELSWITRILYKLPMVHQARILYIMFGITDGGKYMTRTVQ